MSTKSKKTRKHQGIIQSGGNKGKLKKGYKYSGKKLKSGLPQILKVTKKKNKSQRGGFQAAWQRDKYNDDFTKMLKETFGAPSKLGKWEKQKVAPRYRNTIVYKHPHYQNITITYVRNHKNSLHPMISDAFVEKISSKGRWERNQGVGPFDTKDNLKNKLQNKNIWDIHATETEYDNYGNERKKWHVYGVNDYKPQEHPKGTFIYIPSDGEYEDGDRVAYKNLGNALVDFINNLDQYIRNKVTKNKNKITEYKD